MLRTSTTTQTTESERQAVVSPSTSTGRTDTPRRLNESSESTQVAYRHDPGIDEKQLLLRVAFTRELPIRFQATIPYLRIRLASIIRPDGEGRFSISRNWISKILLPAIWEEVYSFFEAWDIDCDASYDMQTVFEDARLHPERMSDEISRGLDFSELGPHLPRLTTTDLRSVIQDLYDSSQFESHLVLYFRGRLGRMARKALEGSASLTHHLNVH